MSAVEILDGDIYLGAENNFNLFTVRKNSEGTAEEERGHLEVLGEYHLGEFINRFRHGSLVMHLTDSDGGQIPTAIFRTKKTVDAKNFLDGDLIETFLDLSHSRMEEIGKTMNTTVEELYERVEELAKLY
ncbi:DNA damage-binding protein 1-like [Populus alba x Populus x berolinensis]|nr:DNA damage-binding protein 1-like [Populus alba x Populus x berolinensis]